MKITNQQFEDFLAQKFANSYTGPKDRMDIAFEVWMENLDVQEVIDYAEEWGDTIRPVLPEVKVIMK